MENCKNIYKEIKEIVKDIPEPRGIIHVGGHKGQEGIYYKGVFENILFIEPIPYCAEILRKRKYDVIEAAITEKEEIIPFYITETSDEFSSIFTGPYKTKEKIMVKSMPLSKIEPNDFNVLAIDVQGASMDVLKSSKLNYEVIIFEASKNPRYDGEQPMEKIISFVEQHGYKLIEKRKHKGSDVFDVLMKRHEKI